MERVQRRRIRLAAPACAVLALGATMCASPPQDAGRASTSPRLVVLLVIDQVRAERMLNPDREYTAGLARLLDEGRIYENAHHVHALTWTAAGHASLVSGVHPSRHGVIGNSWWERSERAQVGAATDTGTRRLDRPDRTGASGFRMRVTSLGDWLKEHNPASQVWSVSIKDRSSAIAAGQRADGAYWYDFERGRFVTSDYYMREEPGWAIAFDEARSIEAYRGGWQLLLDPESYVRPDDGAGEDPPSTFPHPFSDGDAFYKEIYNSPFGDRFTFEFARALIEGQQLGADDASDLLIVSASSSDEIGHSYGPWSREIEDYDLRLDLMLGEFFEQLDRVAGPDGWLVALTSDHGVVALPEQTEGERFRRQPLFGLIQTAFEAGLEAQGVDPEHVRLAVANGLVLDADPHVDAGRLAALRKRMAEDLRRHPRIEDVFTWDELASEVPLDRPYEAEFRRSFDPARSADLMFRFREFDLAPAGGSGTNHGSTYGYDTHVPLIFLGAGFPAERIARPVRTVDLAPTLANCLGIEPPEGLDGEILFDGPAQERAACFTTTRRGAWARPR